MVHELSFLMCKGADSSNLMMYPLQVKPVVFLYKVKPLAVTTVCVCNNRVEWRSDNTNTAISYYNSSQILLQCKSLGL